MFEKLNTIEVAMCGFDEVKTWMWVLYKNTERRADIRQKNLGIGICLMDCFRLTGDRA